eukprot:6187836-Pleurochrysis_carterae.AAC.2
MLAYSRMHMHACAHARAPDYTCSKSHASTLPSYGEYDPPVQADQDGFGFACALLASGAFLLRVDPHPLGGDLPQDPRNDEAVALSGDPDEDETFPPKHNAHHRERRHPAHDQPCHVRAAEPGYSS